MARVWGIFHLKQWISVFIPLAIPNRFSDGTCTDATCWITVAAFQRGLTLYPCTSAVDGNVGDAVLLGPPLSVTESDLDEMVDRLAASAWETLPP